MESKKNNFNIEQEALKYLSFWKWIILSVFISFIISFLYLKYSKDLYQSTAKIKILDNTNTAFILPANNVSFLGNDEVGKGNEIIIMKSYLVIGKVVDNLNLTTEIHGVGTIKTVELWDNNPFKIIWLKEKDSLDNMHTSFKIALTKEGYKLSGSTKVYKFGETNFDSTIPFKLALKDKSFLKHAIDKEYEIILKTRKSVVQSISNNIDINNVIKQSDVLSITLNGFNKEKITDIINTLIEVFNEDGIKDRQLVSKKTIKFVDERFKYIFKELDSIETYKANFKRDRKFSFVEADAGLLMQNNFDSKSKLEDANIQIALSKLMMNAINATKGPELLPSNIGIENGEVNGLIKDYNEQILKRNKLLLSGGGESNPIVNESSKLASQIKNNIKASLIEYQNVLEYNRNEINKINDLDIAKYSTVPFNEKGIRSIERQQSIKESLYILLLQKREEAAINLAITNPSIKIVDYAVFSDEPIAPERNIIYIISLIIGVLIPIILIYIYYLFENKINSKEDIESLIKDIPVIAEIPYIESEDKLITFFDRSILSESFRILRNNINYINPLKDNGSVLFVTSSIKGEGKTFISINLAITLSTLDKKVVLVGADLRNPQLHKNLEVRKNLKGVTNYLYDTSVKIDDIKMKYSDKNNLNFDIIFSGNIPPNPAELLSNGRFELLLNEIKNDYDYIIVDTAPTLLVADTTLISHLADTVLYVTRANFTEKKLLKFISNLKTLNSIKNIGIILNNVKQNRGYGYRYSYNYGYGYGYENDIIQDNSLNRMKKFLKYLFKKHTVK